MEKTYRVDIYDNQNNIIDFMEIEAESEAEAEELAEENYVSSLSFLASLEE